MKKQQGFSLIELLIVVGIIGALTAIAVPAYQNFQEESTVTAGVASLKGLRTVIETDIQGGKDFPTDAQLANFGELQGVEVSANADTTGTLQVSQEGLFIAEYSRDVNGVWACEFNSRTADVDVDGCDRTALVIP